MTTTLEALKATAALICIVLALPVILVLGLTAMTLAWAGARISAALGDGE